MWFSAILVFPLVLRANIPGELVFDHFPLGEKVEARALIQSRDGWLWLGTNQGLIRYDGYGFRAWGPGEHNETPGNITTLFEDRDGRLWLGTRDQGLVHFDPVSESFEVIEHDSELHVTALVRDRAGKLWVGSASQGLFLLDGSGKKLVRPDIWESLPQNITALHLAGDLWIGSSDGLTRLSNQQRYRRYEAVRMVTRIRDYDGSLWCLSESGLYKLNLNTGGLRIVSPEPVSMQGQPPRDLIVDKNGLWLATDRSLGRKEATGPWTWTTHDPHNNESLPIGAIVDLLHGRFGILWILTRNGLSRADPTRPQFRHIGSEQGLSNTRIHAVVADADGSMWIGSNLGLSRIGTDGRLTRPLVTDIGRVQAIYPLDEQHTLVGSGRGLFLYNGQSAGPIPLSDGQQPSVTVVQRDLGGDLWVGSEVGLFSLKGKPEAGFEAHLVEAGDTRALLPDHEGMLWCAFSDSLLHGLPNSFQSLPLPSKKFSIQCLHEDEAGDLWIGTTAQGLWRLPGDNHWQHLRQLPVESVVAIHPDSRGRLWLASNRGLVCYEPDYQAHRLYGAEFGFQQFAFNAQAVGEAPGGQLFFGGKMGLISFSPGLIERSAISPGLIAWPPPGRADFTNGHLQLAQGQHDLTLIVGVLHHFRPERNRGAIMLEGFDNYWHPIDGKPVPLRWSQLPAGNYQFRLKGHGADGVWAETRQPLRVTVSDKEGFPVAAWLGILLFGMALGWVLRRRGTTQRAHRDGAASLRRLAELQQEFTSATAERLRTPLNELMGLAESILEGASGTLSESTRANMGLIADSGRRLAEMIEDLHDFSYLHQEASLMGHMANPHACVDVVTTGLNPRAERHGLSLVNEVPLSISGVRGHEGRLQEIFRHLIFLAIELGVRGRLMIEADQDDSHVTMSFILESADLNDAEYNSLRRELYEDVQGCHLDLAIADRLVQLHGDQLLLERRASELVFSFRLVRTHDDEWERTVDYELEEAQDTRVPEGAFTILVIEDQPSSRRLLTNYLKLARYQFREAKDGREALTLLKGDVTFDLVLLDLVLPGRSGFQICRDIRGLYSFHELPIILMAGDQQMPDLATAFDLGANDYLRKPIQKDELLIRVKTHLRLLDAGRNLEQRVAVRTLELQMRNQEILKTQNQLIVQAKMASLGTLTAGIAHEIKNPLNFVTNFADIVVELAAELNDRLPEIKPYLDEELFEDIAADLEDLRQNTRRILVHGKRANHIVQSMMEVAGDDGAERQLISINQLVDEFTNMAYQGAITRYRQKIFLQKDYDPKVGKLEVASHNLSRVIVSLVNNAIEEVLSQKDDESVYEPFIWVTTIDEEDHVVIKIKDNGGGIPKANLNRIFTPFFTTRPQGGGHIGLGLYFSYDIIVHQHHGELTVQTVEGEYSEFTIRLPKP